MHEEDTTKEEWRPIPVQRGQLGLWRLDPETVARVAEEER